MNYNRWLRVVSADMLMCCPLFVEWPGLRCMPWQHLVSGLTNQRLRGAVLPGMCMLPQAVRLVELLDEAKERCVASVRERQETTIERGGEEISAEELDNISSVMGYGAVKYADLKNNRSTNYK